MYRYDEYDKSIVIDGFEKGIDESPEKGLSNLQNVNIVSIPGEASVGFSTIASTPPVALSAGSITSVSGSRVTFSAAIPTAYDGMAVTFSNVGSYTGLTVGSCYWLASFASGTTTALVYSDPNTQLAQQVTVTGNGTGLFTVFNMVQPRYFTQASNRSNANPAGFMVDTNGNVWSNRYSIPVYGSATSTYWRFMGNSVLHAGGSSPGNGITGNGYGGHNTNDQSAGNGIVYYSGSNNVGWIFVFSNGSVDLLYLSDPIVWKYGWNISAGTFPNSPSVQFTMDSGDTVNTIHQAIVAPDARMYFCDWYNVRKLFQTGTSAFDPTDSTTYTYTTYPLLPYNDYAQCLSPLGTDMLIGGQKNAAYMWDTTSTLVKYPILLPENNIVNIITVDSNAYIFTGNRGRIYVTTGSAANLYKKIPDHLSQTTEPYYTWGGATYNKNQLYFGLYAVTNAKTTNANYGGVWAIDLDTKALRLVNQLSYGTYDGYATAIAPNFSVDPAGAGLFIGWVSAVVNNTPTATAAGLDSTSSNPYTNSTAVIESDLIPIGTFGKPRNSGQVEFKLSSPLVAGESITLYSRTNFNGTYTALSFLTTPTTGDISGTAHCNFKNAQWLQLKAVLNSVASSPSYVRLVQLRVTNVGQ